MGTFIVILLLVALVLNAVQWFRNGTLIKEVIDLEREHATDESVNVKLRAQLVVLRDTIATLETQLDQEVEPVRHKRKR